MQLRHFPNFPSQLIAPRQVDVWLPPGFDPTTSTRYPVLYMHDGQNLFEPEHAFIGVDWGIDPALNRLIRKKAVQPPIVVGIWNTLNRIGDYMPEDAFQKEKHLQHLQEYLSNRWPELQLKIGGNAYLAFLVEELKPWVDANFPTLPDQAHTYIMGSSMGGLISLYALCQYPQVFGGAGCLSNAWNIEGRQLLRYFSRHLPSPQGHKLYLDMGGAENKGAAANKSLLKGQNIMQKEAIKAGFREGDNLLTRVFKTHIHSEKDWRRRVHIPLEFLLSPLPDV